MVERTEEVVRVAAGSGEVVAVAAGSGEEGAVAGVCSGGEEGDVAAAAAAVCSGAQGRWSWVGLRRACGGSKP